MSKAFYLPLIMSLLVVSCREKSPAGPQNSNTMGAPNSESRSLFFTGETWGCANFSVYKQSEDKTKVVAVSGGTRDLNLKTSSRTFYLATTPGLRVAIHDYGSARINLKEYCSDLVRQDAPRPQFIDATAGKLTILISRKKGEYGPFPAYAITVILEDVNFPDVNGITYLIEKAEIQDVVVGWLPG
jgi:hypothetical protein